MEQQSQEQEAGLWTAAVFGNIEAIVLLFANLQDVNLSLIFG